jgi:hypothetical protein
MRTLGRSSIRTTFDVHGRLISEEEEFGGTLVARGSQDERTTIPRRWVNSGIAWWTQGDSILPF